MRYDGSPPPAFWEWWDRMGSNHQLVKVRSQKFPIVFCWCHQEKKSIISFDPQTVTLHYWEPCSPSQHHRPYQYTTTRDVPTCENWVALSSGVWLNSVAWVMWLFLGWSWIPFGLHWFGKGNHTLDICRIHKKYSFNIFNIFCKIQYIKAHCLMQILLSPVRNHGHTEGFTICGQLMTK